MKTQEVARRCDNAACPTRGRWRRFWRGPVPGISLGQLWYCSPACLEPVLAEKVTRLVSAAYPRTVKEHRVPLGLVLVSLGLVSQEDIQRALRAKREAGSGRVGDWLLELGVATEQEIATALGAQWSCPIFPLENHRRYLECAGLVPLALMETFRMVPAHYLPDSHFLYVAFAEGVDYTVLYALEQMFACRTEPCVATQSGLTKALLEIRRQPRPPETVHENLDGVPEVTAEILNGVAAARATKLQVVGCAEYVWARLESNGGPHNLLFHVLAKAPQFYDISRLRRPSLLPSSA